MLAFALAVFFPPGASQSNQRPSADRDTVVLDGAGGGLRVPAREGRAFIAIANELRERVPPGEPIFTYPGDFGFYEFTGRPNPTRHMWVDFYADAEEFEKILRTLDREQVQAIVVRSPQLIRNPDRHVFVRGLKARFRTAAIHEPFVLAVRYRVPGSK